MALGLIVDGQSLDIPGAWKHNRSLRRLRDTIASRGENRVISKVPGRRAYAPILDQTIVDLELDVFGRKDSAGIDHADTLDGLDENMDYLSDWVRAHIDGATATWPATLETKSGRTYSGNVQLRNWQVAQEEVTKVVIGYDVIIPAGTWTETTP